MPLTVTGSGAPSNSAVAVQRITEVGVALCRDVVPAGLQGALLDQLTTYPETLRRTTGPGASEVQDALTLPAILDLIDLPLVVDVVDALFIGQARLLSATGRILAPGGPAQKLHRDYPRQWPLRRPSRTLWAVYPCLIVAFYPGGLNMENGPLLVAPGTQADRVGDSEVSPEYLLPGPNDLVFFDAAVLHAGGSNTSLAHRYAAFLDFAPAYVRRPHRVALDRTGLSLTQERLLGDWQSR